MQTKISSDFWEDADIERVPPDIKLAALWMLTNPQMTFFGYAETSARRFAFDTGLPEEFFTRAFEALPKTFVRTSKGYFVPNYIRRQYGEGVSLLKNNIGKGLVRAFIALRDDEVRKLIADEYEEISQAAESLLACKGLASPCQVVRSKEKGIRSKEKGVRSALQGGAGGSIALVLTDQPFADFARMLGALFDRPPESPWPAGEVALVAQLFASGWGGDAAGVAALRAYYTEKIVPEQDRRRKSLLKLMENFSGEVDRARKFVRERGQQTNPSGLAEA